MDWFNRKRVAELEAEVSRLRLEIEAAPMFINVPDAQLPPEARQVAKHVLRDVERELAKALKPELLRVVMEAAHRMPEQPPARLAFDPHMNYISVRARIPELHFNIQTMF